MFRVHLHRAVASRRTFTDLASISLPLQEALQHAQVATGLSWPLLIPLTTVAVRGAFTAPLAVWNRVRARRQAQLQPLLGAMVPVIKAQLAAHGGSQLTGEQIRVLAAKERRKRRIALYREFHCENWKTLLLPAVQVPIFVLMSLAFRSLCGYQLVDTEFGLVDMGSMLWCPSLASPDPYGIFPLLLGGVCFGNVELVTRQMPQTVTNGPSVTGFIATCSRAGSLVFTALAFQAPLAIELYWLSSNSFSLVQNLLFEKYLPVRVKPEYPALPPSVIGAAAADGEPVKSHKID